MYNNRQPLGDLPASAEIKMPFLVVCTNNLSLIWSLFFTTSRMLSKMPTRPLPRVLVCIFLVPPAVVPRSSKYSFIPLWLLYIPLVGKELSYNWGLVHAAQANFIASHFLTRLSRVIQKSNEA
jgi:hypothetical protein